jgi:urea ABC transporter ATP-binding protein UrtE
MSSEPAMLELRGVDVGYGGVAAVRDLSLEVRRGEIVGLIGPNGAGKSTTLHAIMGLVPARAGEILLSGQSLRGRAPESVAQRGVALVPEGRRIFSELSVEENLQLGLAGRRSRDGVDADIASVYELFPIVEEFRRRPAGALSGGQQQQLAIGRALVMRPRLLLLDEPTEGIQPSIIKDIGRAIRFLRDQAGIAVLLVEQYLDFCRELADEVNIMERGQIVHTGPAADLDKPEVRRLLTV